MFRIGFDSNRRRVPSARAAFLLFLQAFGLTVWPALADDLLPDLDVCRSAVDSSQPLGESLAQAEDLRDAADRLRHYDYDRCFRLGRSCFAQVDSNILTGVENDSYIACRDKETSDRSDQDAWLRKKQEFIACVAADLERRATDLEARAKSADNKPKLETQISDLEHTTGAIDTNGIKVLASDSTWCSTRGKNRARVLCKDGTGALADGQGQQEIFWNANIDGKICFGGYDQPTACFSVTVEKGLFSLTAGDGSVSDVVRVVPRVEKRWSSSCAGAN